MQRGAPAGGDTGTADGMRATTEFDRRVGPGSALSAEAGAIAHACADMAARFLAGGKLVVFGNGAGATDAAHVAVEFVHPVIVGKRRCRPCR